MNNKTRFCGQEKKRRVLNSNVPHDRFRSLGKHPSQQPINGADYCEFHSSAVLGKNPQGAGVAARPDIGPHAADANEPITSIAAPSVFFVRHANWEQSEEVNLDAYINFTQILDQPGGIILFIIFPYSHANPNFRNRSLQSKIVRTGYQLASSHIFPTFTTKKKSI